MEKNNPVRTRLKEDMLDKFVHDQLSVWPQAAANFRTLKNVEIRQMQVRGIDVSVQFNPGRIRSSAAKTDAASLQARKCFLCAENRTAEQKSMKFEGRKGRKYDVLVNLYPIFHNHLVIAASEHTPQTISRRYVDMLDLSKKFQGYTILYNGPKCGASAPDHMHFQACPRGLMPLEAEIDRLLSLMQAAGKEKGVPNCEEIPGIPSQVDGHLDYMTSVQEAQLYHYKHFTKGIFAMRARTAKSMAKLFYRLADSIPVSEDDTEPKVNLLTYFAGGEYRAIVILRNSHRSHHYYSDGEDHLTMSPGSVDMGGFFIVPCREEYEKISPELLTEMLSEVSVSKSDEQAVIWKLTRTQPKIEVGIMSAPEICFEIISDGAGPQKVCYREGLIDYNGTLYNELYFEAATMSTMFAEPTFILHDVRIGLDFHWERKQNQKFAGSLKFIAGEGKVTAVNIIGVEDYLLSVISSEMKASAPLQLLKAHAVISRSWLMAQISARHGHKKAVVPEGVHNLQDLIRDIDERLHAVGQNLSESPVDSVSDQASGDGKKIVEICKWFDHEEHKHFDVCADDHCQRYQGLGMAVGEKVRTAIDETWGQVLEYEGKVCDARFSKCCGGTTEKFSTCWEDRDVPYLQSFADESSHLLSLEPCGGEHERTIHHDGAFCNTENAGILSTVLNDYDLETKDFYRWTVEYDSDELAALISRKSGCDIGRLVAIEALERGESGRISKLKIIGTGKVLVIGKELMVRKMLSETHLKSSAFEVDFIDGNRVRLSGKGWGHGVGLCQIGAAVMAAEGYDYVTILKHYYPGAVLITHDSR